MGLVEGDLAIGGDVAGGLPQGSAIHEDLHALVVEDPEAEAVVGPELREVNGLAEPDRRRVPAGAGPDGGRARGAEAGGPPRPGSVVEVGFGPALARVNRAIGPDRRPARALGLAGGQDRDPTGGQPIDGRAEVRWDARVGG